MNEQTQIENKANTSVLMIVLGAIIALMLYSIYLTGSLVANLSNVGLFGAMWDSALGGGATVHAMVLFVALIIGAAHLLNKAIGEKSQVIAKVISKLMKLPVSLVLIFLALWLGALGYGKFDTNVTGANLNGGGYVLELINVVSILYLTFFVKKV